MFIVKIQTPLFGGSEVLVYNEDKSVMEMFPNSLEIERAMAGEDKKFFYAKNVKVNEGFILDIIKEAPWQDW